MAIFEYQTEILIGKHYPEHTGLSIEEFLRLLEPLRHQLHTLQLQDVDFEKGYLPFAIVISSELMSAKKMMHLVTYSGKPGIDIMRPKEPEDFQHIPSITIPNKSAYLIVGIDRGRESLNIVPKEAMISITQKNRSALTIEEGIALITYYPEFLLKNNCFLLLASRIPNDKRVLAIWINGAKQANLGWCWEGNPHTWLGSASCERRVG